MRAALSCTVSVVLVYRAWRNTNAADQQGSALNAGGDRSVNHMGCRFLLVQGDQFCNVAQWGWSFYNSIGSPMNSGFLDNLDCIELMSCSKI